MIYSRRKVLWFDAVIQRITSLSIRLTINATAAHAATSQSDREHLAPMI